MSRHAREAFSALLQPHFSRLYSLAYRLTGTRADAEDLVQDVLLKLYERRAELSAIRHLASWLGRVVYNQFIDYKRRYGRQPLTLVGTTTELDAALEASGGASQRDDPSRLSSRAQDHKALTLALDKLSEEHRLVLVMHDMEGYRLPELQQITGIAVGTLKSRLHRARARLKSLLQRHPAQLINGTFSNATACKSVDGAGNDAL